MKDIILYDTDNYSPILNEEWAKQLAEDYGDEEMDNDELENRIQEFMDLQQEEDFDNVVKEINESVGNLLVYYPWLEQSVGEMAFDRAHSDFTNTIEEIIDSHRNSCINNITIGIDETGTLFIDISSGNAMFPTRTKIKSLTENGQNIIDNFDDSSDMRRENAGWFDNLSDNGFDEEDLYRVLWENPKFSESVLKSLKLNDDCMLPNAHKLKELLDTLEKNNQNFRRMR